MFLPSTMHASSASSIAAATDFDAGIFADSRTDTSSVVLSTASAYTYCTCGTPDYSSPALASATISSPPTPFKPSSSLPTSAPVLAAPASLAPASPKATRSASMVGSLTKVLLSKLFICFAFYINRWLHSYDIYTRFTQAHSYATLRSYSPRVT